MKRIRPRRRSQASHTPEGSWAISYGDMLTLLLGFFIMFFSIDQKEVQEKRLQRSILATLSAKKHVKKVPEKFDKDIDEKTFDYLGVKVKAIGKRVIVEFPDHSFFNSGQTKLTRKGRIALRNFAERFIPFAGKNLINVVGYTDDKPVRKMNWRFKDNLELSALRAVAAQRVLQSSGIPINRTRIGGFGVKKLLKKNKTMSHRELQRKRSFSRTIVLVIEPENVL